MWSALPRWYSDSGYAVSTYEYSPDADAPALSRILERRMERDGIQDDLDNVIDLAAIEELQVLYHERDRDLRSVLTLAHSAARHALLRGGTRVEARDVRTVVAKLQA